MLAFAYIMGFEAYSQLNVKPWRFNLKQRDASDRTLKLKMTRTLEQFCANHIVYYYGQQIIDYRISLSQDCFAMGVVVPLLGNTARLVAIPYKASLPYHGQAIAIIKSRTHAIQEKLLGRWSKDRPSV